MTDIPGSSGVPLDIQQLVAQHLAQYQQLAARAEAAERVTEHLAELGATASSLRNEVTVSVSPSGLLSDVRISEAAVNLGAAGLSHLLMTTLRQALVTLEENAVQAMEDAEGGEIAAATLAEIRTGLSGPLAALDQDGTDIRLN
ncbi:DNA-binding protein YbaB [Microbacterium sp. SORGH_AS428]|uniref:YbaB/EbfC family nucleoid-associated protein n=1 Tax=Microbacterium sp. SORGH_AS_0428 TaxID=3041788 RepID=UPI0028582902|nr:YbaB/EbfC family nucleoid-associated protein [Microbacterium sp. SORGH_AS_0428]MDR6199570.1 DNA-binding protein YbaB [Microbacterium sp. SORGH_AS_0428]